MYHFCVPTFMLLQMELPQWRSQALATIATVFRVTKDFAEKRLEMFERRKAGIQFQKRLAYLLSDKRPKAEYEEDQPPLQVAEAKALYNIRRRG